METIGIRCDQHGLGDINHIAHCLQLYLRRGYRVQVHIEENKRWLWQLSGVEIVNDPSLPNHGYPYLPSIEAFFDLSLPDHSSSKIAGFFDHPALPCLGSKEDVWRELCEVRLNVSDMLIERQQINTIDVDIARLPRPIFAVHSKGTNWSEKKSIPDHTAWDLLNQLLDTGGSVIVLDYDARVPTISGHNRVINIKPQWGHLGIEQLVYVVSKVNCMIGVDSGPFHVASLLTDTPCVGVFRQIPCVRCCLPRNNTTYVVPAERDFEHWKRRSKDWNFWYYSTMNGVMISEVAQEIVRRHVAKLNTGVSHAKINPESIPGRYLYRRIDHDERYLTLTPDGRITEGSAGCERVWKIEATPAGDVLTIYGDHGGPTCHLSPVGGDVFKGRWLAYEKMPIELIRNTTQLQPIDRQVEAMKSPQHWHTIPNAAVTEVHRLRDERRLVTTKQVIQEQTEKLAAMDGVPTSTLVQTLKDHQERRERAEAEYRARQTTGYPQRVEESETGHPSDSLPDWHHEFVVGIPTLIRFDLLHKCIESILAGTALPRIIYVIDNSEGLPGRPAWPGHPSRRVRIIKPTVNLGVSRSWNLLYHLTESPLIILNDDIEVGANLLERMVWKSHVHEYVVADESHAFTAFSLSRNAVRMLGGFDELFYPAYHEDCDMGYRLALDGVRPSCPKSDGFINNGPSATKAAMTPEERQALDAGYSAGARRYLAKWGGPPHQEQFTTPFNGGNDRE